MPVPRVTPTPSLNSALAAWALLVCARGHARGWRERAACPAVLPWRVGCSPSTRWVEAAGVYGGVPQAGAHRASRDQQARIGRRSRAEQPAAGDGKQRPLVPRSRCLPRLTRGVRPHAMHWWNLSAAKRDLGGGALGSKTLLPYVLAFVVLETAVVVSRRVVCAHIHQ
jgi:hypothetical protein